MTPKRYFLLILILGTLSAIGPFSIDMYLPGFPAIAKDLDTTVAHIALSLSSFFIGISTGQLFYGPLLDRFGRKKPLYFGLSLYVLASIGCAMATTADALIALRFFQALGGCVGMVASRAMVRDIFPVNENARVFSTLMLVIGVSPLIAPTLGGYVSTVFGWHYVFAILTVMGLLILLGVHFILPESRKGDAGFSLRPRSILNNYYSVLIHPQFYTYTFSGAIAGAGLYAYIAGSPFVFMEMFRVSGQHYGWIFAFIAMGLVGSSQMNSLLLKKGFKSERIIIWALLCQSFTGILLFISAINHWLSPYNAVGMICIFLCCQGFIFPNASALALAPFSKNAGSASALMGGFQMGLGALASAMVSMLSNNTALPMTGIMATCATASFCILMVGNQIVRYKAMIETAEEESAECIKSF
jgi:DHA1 family bicyclomycin/chloramphenicol resistance-like MFS transporter